ncbi:MAG TPA: DUF1572 family protein [Anaerolineales bacterium]|nr:DUF1572 family protein [Anaerolineales bacterium]HLO30961.1 DUF1572 family protein [Anaerolineales bacterium]
MQEVYKALLEQFQELHLEVLKSLEELPSETLDWIPGPEMNSLSVLIIHLSGAERYWIGDVIKGDSSHRNRDAEFEVSGLSRAALKGRIGDLETYEKAAFEGMRLEELEEERVLPDGRKHSVAWALSHALEHSAIHVGHIQMLSQLWKQGKQGN